MHRYVCVCVCTKRLALIWRGSSWWLPWQTKQTPLSLARRPLTRLYSGNVGGWEAAHNTQSLFTQQQHLANRPEITRRRQMEHRGAIHALGMGWIGMDGSLGGVKYRAPSKSCQNKWRTYHYHADSRCHGCAKNTETT